jgi:hypothetical protein
MPYKAGCNYASHGSCPPLLAKLAPPCEAPLECRTSSNYWNHRVAIRAGNAILHRRPVASLRSRTEDDHVTALEAVGTSIQTSLVGTTVPTYRVSGARMRSEILATLATAVYLLIRASTQTILSGKIVWKERKLLGLGFGCRWRRR